MKIIVSYLLVISSLGVMAQTTVQTKKLDFENKFYVSWGWNRGWYTKSDIHMVGDDYDFTLKDVSASDRQSEFSLKKYLFLTQFSVPQTNLKLGYYLNKNYSVSVGFDHMKYVVDQYQNTTITGHIDRDGKYKGVYTNDEINLAYDFLRFEHTDGLNYVFLEINRHDEWLDFAKSKVRVSTMFGAGPALLRPRTDVTLMMRQGRNVYHNAGFGVNGKAGINILLFNHITISSEVKAGYINMPNIHATEIKKDLANQQFGFLQANILMGATFGFK